MGGTWGRIPDAGIRYIRTGCRLIMMNSGQKKGCQSLVLMTEERRPIMFCYLPPPRGGVQVPKDDCATDTLNRMNIMK